MKTLAGGGERPRRRLGRRRPRSLRTAPPARAPITRVTVIGAEPFPDRATAEAWLDDLRGRPEALARELADGLKQLNWMLRAHRAATRDPYVREVSARQALARRVGYGDGNAVADGRYAAAVEVRSPPERRGRRAERLAPEESVAGLLGGREELLACEELVLRAALDLDAGRHREAALQARIALETLLAELAGGGGPAGTRAGPALAGLDERRQALARAANRALDGDLDRDEREAVEGAVEAMRAALARRPAR
jgi:hypothetical protein